MTTMLKFPSTYAAAAAAASLSIASRGSCRQLSSLHQQCRSLVSTSHAMGGIERGHTSFRNKSVLFSLRAGAQQQQSQQDEQFARSFGAAAAPSSSSVPPSPPNVRFDPDYEPPVTDVEVPFETHVKNIALASAIVAFCCGVFWYSMNAVGQAGSGGSDDPLAGLKQEAEQARNKLDRDTQNVKEANEMLKQFKAGGYDPDQIVEEDEQEDPSKKRAWYKFW